MIISEKNRREISKYLFQEGVCYAKKDYNLAKHPLIDVPNLQVIKLMQSFKSKEYVRETFAWMHYYWYLTNEGIEFLRGYLNLPSEIVPATLKKSVRPPARPFAGGGGPPGDRPRGPPRFEGDRPRFGDREGYRGGPRGRRESMVAVRRKGLRRRSSRLSGALVEDQVLAVEVVALVLDQRAPIFLEILAII
ncbi:40S ribosomal protein S10 [Acorus calamus]|uniref:40S ribosomal protein S10 n=1 Tax=Acorus calamus TaxID=4465 RepID=A0AAV9F7A9_ACOCL|nr:40S ribosomal protein S10 [Acorus calamus]